MPFKQCLCPVQISDPDGVSLRYPFLRVIVIHILFGRAEAVEGFSYYFNGQKPFHNFIC